MALQPASIFVESLRRPIRDRILKGSIFSKMIHGAIFLVSSSTVSEGDVSVRLINCYSAASDKIVQKRPH
jgi:hypothetical protein